MKSFMLSLAFVFGLTTFAVAQNVTPASRLAWDQSAPTIAEARAYTYRYRADGVTSVATELSGVTCAGTVSPFVCSVAFPAFTPGPHSIQVSAANAAGESAMSTPLPFVFVVVPAVPSDLRLVP